MSESSCETLHTFPVFFPPAAAPSVFSSRTSSQQIVLPNPPVEPPQNQALPYLQIQQYPKRHHLPWLCKTRKHPSPRLVPKRTLLKQPKCKFPNLAFPQMILMGTFPIFPLSGNKLFIQMPLLVSTALILRYGFREPDGVIGGNRDPLV